MCSYEEFYLDYYNISVPDNSALGSWMHISICFLLLRKSKLDQLSLA